LNDRNSMNIVNFKKYAPEFILSILNSKLISFWFVYKFGKMQRGIFPQFKINELEIFPIIDINDINQKALINLVEKIHSLKEQNEATNELETEIDIMVYKLYELTYDEVKIVDPDFLVNEFTYNTILI
jgi:hypothetical protein